MTKNLLYLCIGAALGYVAGKSVAERVCADEIAEVKEFYTDVANTRIAEVRAEFQDSVKGNDSETETGVREAANALLAYQGGVPTLVVDDKPLAYAYEASPYVRQDPYVITSEQYVDDEAGYEQITLTYYEGDGVFADKDDVIFDRARDSLGESNLSRFGEESQDENVVYVRNERIRRDFEVIRTEGNFADEVLGSIVEPD